MAGHSSAGRDYRYSQNADPRSQQESDPLAELARLIGQADPFANAERNAQPQQQDDYQHADATQDQYAKDQDAYATEVQDDPPPPAWLQSAQQAHSQHMQAHAAEVEDFAQAPWPPAREPQQDAAVYEPHPDDRYYVEQQREQARGAYPQDDTRYDDALYGRDPHAHARDNGPPYAYPGHEQGYDDEAGEEQDSGRRGGWMKIAAVLALAVLGTGGAFAYRSYVGGPKGEPPVIKADASPSKVVPPAPSKDPSGKVITDRVGQSGERIVPREEQPVDVAAVAPPAAPSSGPRVVFPPLSQQQNNPLPARATSNQPAAQANAAMSGGVMEEPKRIRTLSIRPDQAEVPAEQVAPSQAVAPAVAVPPRTVPAMPVQTQSPAPRAAAPSSSGPMQLSPQGQANQRTAAVAPQAPVATAPSQGGGYLVQVSSQRSEGDALASYRAMQAKYSGVLGSRQPVIRRADLPAGTYYRAMVGPFASQQDASQLCASLKAAGGNCLVQRN